MTSPFNLRRPAISFELLASFAALRAKRRSESLLAQGATMMTTSDPRDPNQVPDGMKDEVGKSNPAPSDFNDDGEVEEDFEGDDDEMNDEEE